MFFVMSNKIFQLESLLMYFKSSLVIKLYFLQWGLYYSKCTQHLLITIATTKILANIGAIPLNFNATSSASLFYINLVVCSVIV